MWEGGSIHPYLKDRQQFPREELFIILQGKMGGPTATHLLTLHNRKARQHNRHKMPPQQQPWYCTQEQNAFSSLCPPVSECSDWPSPASCFLHLPDCPWTDKLRHLGSTFPVLNSKRKLLSYGFLALAIN